MDNGQLPFHYKDKQLVEELLKNVSLVIKDSDASEEKESVRSFLQQISQAISFVAVGSSQVGKSCLLNALFQFALFNNEDISETGGFCEYRSGAEEARLHPDEYTSRIFHMADQLNGLEVVDMPGIEKLDQKELRERVTAYVQKSNVLLAVYDARNIKDHVMWELLENIKAEKVVFVLTKCDLAESDILEENENKLKQYMSEAGLQAPVFRVSSKWEEAGLTEKSGMEELRSYISSHVIGENRVLSNQQKNLSKLNNMLGQLSESFEKRMQQYEQDAAVLRNINVSLDSFVTNNQTLVDDLKESLRREIDREVEHYQDEVITKLDPNKIKERFPNGNADFVDYLNLVNESCRKRMSDNVNRMTRESVQAYLAKLEQVFEEATGYLRERKALIALEDKFYGSMIESKKTLVHRAANNAEVAKDFYLTLSEASEELFMKLWEARSDRDLFVKNFALAGGVVGAAAGGVAGYAASGVLSAGLKLAAELSGKKLLETLVGFIVPGGSVIWPIVVGLIGAVFIAKMAKKIASANTMAQMEKKVAEAIAEFKEEVAKTKAEMTAQILDTVDKMFQRELETVDRSFSEFRMSVNIDGKNIPLLEEKNQERVKIYGFIGMDTYDMFKQGKIDIPELAVHFEKMEALEKEIEEIRAEKQRQEIQTKGSSVCDCGQPLTGENLFCPSCGKPVDNGMITCSCGKTVKSDTQFCSFCGRDLQMEKQKNRSAAPQAVFHQCICGAQVPEGQFMCMECGRKVES